MRTTVAQQIRLTGVHLVLGRVAALDGIDLALEPGTLTALVGANGSGKSTLLSVLAGLQVPTKGQVSGVPDRVALVSQTTRSHDGLPITVRQVVTMGRWADRGRLGRITSTDRELVQHWLDRLALTDLADRQLGELSGGQRQRTLVARGLVQQADLVLLDEPTAAADAESTDRIHQVLGEVTAQGGTVVLATHDRHAAEIADRVVTLAAGRLVGATPG